MEGGFGVMSPLATGCGSVWLERSVRDAEAARSNRAIPTIKNRRVPVKLGPVFCSLNLECVLCCVGPVPVMQGGGAASHQKDIPVVLPTQSVALAAGAIPAAALRGRYFHRSPLRFLSGIFAVLACCAAPCPVAASAGKGIALHLLPYRKPEGRQRLSHKK